MTIARGDIILFKSPQRWQDKVICYVTHGPYFHVAIALDATHGIAATGAGIVVSLFPLVSMTPLVSNTFDTIDMTAYEGNIQIESALSWAGAQIGKQYGWLDIAYQAVKFLFPNNPFQVTMAGHWDCSDFVTRYILKTGYPLPDAFNNPYANTPNDIARIFQVLPARKAVLV